MSDKRIDLEIAKLIGEPIDPNLRVPVAIAEICNVETAEPGEIVKVFEASDANADDIYEIGDSTLTPHKLSAVAPATLTFVGLKSKLEYVLVDDVLGAEDQGALARKKASITRAMDKEELRRIIDGILKIGDCEVESTKDLYKTILALKHQVEDYGDNYVLLVSPDVKEAIDTYEIDYADGSRGYNVSLKALLEELGIKVIKVVGKVNDISLISANTGILVARDSTLAAGKPICFVRRKISPAIAAQMGVESGERLVSVAQVPTIIGGSNTLGYGIFGYESIALAVTNWRAIAYCKEMIPTP